MCEFHHKKQNFGEPKLEILTMVLDLIKYYHMINKIKQIFQKESGQ